MPRPTKLTPDTQTSFDWLFTEDSNEAHAIPDSSPLSLTHRHRMIHALKRETAAQIFSRIPAIGESIHAVSNGAYDAFTMIPVFVDLLDGYLDTLTITTWSIGRTNIILMSQLYDSGKIGSLSLLCGRSFKRRKPADYGLLVETMETRGRFKVAETHAKLILMQHGDVMLTVETSANMTENPRIENITVIHDPLLYAFHHGWMEKLLSG